MAVKAFRPWHISRARFKSFAWSVDIVVIGVLRPK